MPLSGLAPTQPVLMAMNVQVSVKRHRKGVSAGHLDFY